MDSIAQIKAIYSSLIEGIIPKAEEILEKIVGGQIIIDVDWDTFTNSKNELRALQVMEENVFKSLIRAMHVNMENLAADPIHEVHITNVPGGSASSKRLEFHRRKLEYHGCFESGTAGCFTEDQLRTEIASRGKPSSNPSPPSSPSVASDEVTTATRVDEFRRRRRSTVGQLKKEFQDIIRAQIEDQVRTETHHESPETMSQMVAQREKDTGQKIRKDMFVREKKLIDYEPKQFDKGPKFEHRNEKIKKLERDIREKEMEIEIEERECGDDELISMMQAQLEIMKTLLVDELDAEESMQNEKLLDNDIEFSDEEDEPPLEEQKEVPNYSPLASPELSPRKLISSNHISNGQLSSNQLSSSPAKAMSPIDKVKHLTTQSTSSRDSWSSGSDLDMPVQVVYVSEKDANLKEGYLIKRGNKHKNWKRRWFVLRKRCLLYFKAKEYPYPQGTITPIIAVAHVTDDTAKKDNTFVISTPVRLFFCSAESHQEMKGWIAAIEDQITKEPSYSQDNFPHAFNKYHFDAPTKCLYCSYFIWGIGKQGFQCKSCNYVVHKKCLGRVGDSCNPGSTSSPRMSTRAQAQVAPSNPKGDRASSLSPSTSKRTEASFIIKGKR